MYKRFVSLLMAAVMTFGSAALLPEGTFELGTGITASAGSPIPSKGWCGPDVMYTVENDVLTISGSGDTYDYDPQDPDNCRSPFDFDGAENGIKTVIVKNGVTSIGQYMFNHCNQLEKITLPKSLKTIKWGAFSWCKSLRSITVPAGVVDLNILTAFNGCSSLSVINVDKANKLYSSVDGVLYNKKKTSLVKCPPNKSGSVVVPNGVLKIEQTAFKGCSSVKSVKLPDSLRVIDYLAFAEIEGKFTVNFPKNLREIGSYAFYKNGISGYITLPSKLTSLGHGAFELTKNLTGITLPDNLQRTGGSVFKESAIKTVRYGKTEFFHGDDDFEATNVEKVVYSGAKKMLKGEYTNGKDHVSSGVKTRIINNGVTRIDDKAFDGSDKLETLKIADTVEYIGERAFYNCRKLTELTIGKSVKTIGAYAFGGCDQVKRIILPDGLKTIGDGAFWGSGSVESIYIPQSVTSIGLKAIGVTRYWAVNRNMTIYCHRGSEGERYAKENGFKYVLLPTTARFAGKDRAETAAKISKAVSPKTSDTVVIATGFDFHDALAAVPLASAYDAPLLLADRDNLSKTTISEIKRLKAKNVIVVSTTKAKDQNGNNAAIGANVYKQLNALKVNVTKLEGANYYVTAKKVADALGRKKATPTSVFITTDKTYADALSVSPIAAIKGAPILYVDPKAELNSSTATYLKKISPSLNRIYIAGGVNAVSKDVAAKLSEFVPNGKVIRYAGKDRYETCVKINKAFSGTMTGSYVCAAKGYNFPDALAGGVFAAKQKAPLFLADKLDAKATINKVQSSYLKSKNPSKLYIFGGETAVPTALVKTISKACV